jgi:hypothetical protein
LFAQCLFDTYLFDTSRACNTREAREAHEAHEAREAHDTHDTHDTNVNSVLGVRIGSTGK